MFAKIWDFAFRTEYYFDVVDFFSWNLILWWFCGFFCVILFCAYSLVFISLTFIERTFVFWKFIFWAFVSWTLYLVDHYFSDVDLPHTVETFQASKQKRVKRKVFSFWLQFWHRSKRLRRHIKPAEFLDQICGVPWICVAEECWAWKTRMAVPVDKVDFDLSLEAILFQFTILGIDLFFLCLRCHHTVNIPFHPYPYTAIKIIHCIENDLNFILQHCLINVFTDTLSTVRNELFSKPKIGSGQER